MIFIIGGSYQGKQDFACETCGLTEDDFFVCTDQTREIDFSKRAVTHIERFALGCVRRSVDPKAYWQAHRDLIGDLVVIADDISCGVVPIDETLRAWREAAGRANNYLAQEADRVWRVFCGLGQVIK